jgi:uncharacterized protein YjbJ (UPF0337 family)
MKAPSEYRPDEAKPGTACRLATGKWRKLTDNDCQVAEGKRDQQVGRIEERYAIAREEAQRQVADFERRNVRF